MTPEERAEQVYEANYFLPDAALKTALAAAIRDAICEEREAVATEVDTLISDGDNLSHEKLLQRLRHLRDSLRETPKGI